MPALILPPTSESELLAMARRLAGLTLAELASRAGVGMPMDLRRDKGWVGNLVELLLGATASNQPVPDFERIGVELKTVPVRAEDGYPVESTYVTTVPLSGLEELTWDRCKVRHKLAAVLWVPVDGDAATPLPERRVHEPVLWRPDDADWEELRADWEELTDLVRFGQVESITHDLGVYLQVRGKAASADDTSWSVDANGTPARTQRRGFYLRPAITARILGCPDPRS